ncbi:MAG: hypothetical protein JWP37_3430, partial [Mucilaginibacter sp.]|nr:hypothetical protein [Mucilaginibacter sp.]
LVVFRTVATVAITLVVMTIRDNQGGKQRSKQINIKAYLIGY